MLPARRVAALTEAVTVDLDTTDVEVYGRKKRGVAYNYAGQRCGRPHVATWAQTDTALAADLLSGDVDPRSGAAGLLVRWPRFRPLPGPGRCGCARMPVTSPVSWPAPRTPRTSSSRSGPNWV